MVTNQSTGLKRIRISALRFDKQGEVMEEQSIYDGLHEVATQLKYLGTGNAGSSMGAVELLAKEMRDGFERLAGAVERHAEAVEQQANAMGAVADSLNSIGSEILGHGQEIKWAFEKLVSDVYEQFFSGRYGLAVAGRHAKVKTVK
jgi:hypothetical protein